jgi:hypothetical protein
VPLIAVNHIEAHVYAARLAAGRDIFPCVGLVVSGGHTSLFHCRTPLAFDLQRVGRHRPGRLPLGRRLAVLELENLPPRDLS